MQLMRALRTAAVALLVLAAPAGLARAQPAPTPEALALAAEVNGIFTLTQAEAMVDGMLLGIWATLEPVSIPANAPEAVRGEAQTIFIDTLTPVFIEPLGRLMDELLPVFNDAIARSFALDELRTILAFYESTSGRRMLELLPDVGATTMSAAVGTQDAIMGALRAGIDEVNAELRSRGLPSLLIPPDALPPPQARQAIAADMPPNIGLAHAILSTESIVQATATDTAADMFGTLWQLVEPTIPAQADAPLREYLREIMFNALRDGASVILAGVMDQAAMVLANGMTTEEINAAATFFLSPLGRRWASESYALSEELEPQLAAIFEQSTTSVWAAMSAVALRVDALLIERGVRR